jgi:hypothetical protein
MSNDRLEAAPTVALGWALRIRFRPRYNPARELKRDAGVFLERRQGGSSGQGCVFAWESKRLDGFKRWPEEGSQEPQRRAAAEPEASGHARQVIVSSFCRLDSTNSRRANGKT